MSAGKFDWAVKLAIEKLCERLDPDTIAQIDGVVKASIGIKQQLDRIEYVQIEILKMLQANGGLSHNGGTSAVAGNIEPPAATGK